MKELKEVVLEIRLYFSQSFVMILKIEWGVDMCLSKSSFEQFLSKLRETPVTESFLILMLA